jgi:protein SCO1/2
MAATRAQRPGLLSGHATFLVTWLLVLAALVAAAILKSLVLAAPAGAPSGPSPYAYAQIRMAPPLDLIDYRSQPFALASLRGKPVLVFFGYTHCPDICPAIIGQLNLVLRDPIADPWIVYVTVDPERDTPEFLTEYMRYMPAAYTTLTGTATQIRGAADAWGIQYARVETGSAGGYTMAHTAEVYLVDAGGRLRAHYPFGTEAPAIVADLERLAAEGGSS